MKRCIIINWKWVDVLPCGENGQAVSVENLTVLGTEGNDEVYCLNMPREEAAFEDEYDFYYDEPNQLLGEFIQQHFKESEVLLLLHKNAPHFYGSYDVEALQAYGVSHIATFGGGEGFIYDLQNPLGLIDQVGSFSKKAIVGDKRVQQTHFDSIWEYYVLGVRQLLEAFSQSLFPYLLPTTTAPIPEQLQKRASMILEAIQGRSAELGLPLHQQQQLAKVNWSPAFIDALAQTSAGNKIDPILLREEVK